MFKRLGAMLIAATMVISMGALTFSAAAAPVNTITMHDTISNATQSFSTFSAYKIVSWSDAQYGNATIGDAYKSYLITALNGMGKNLGTTPTPNAILGAMKNLIDDNNAAGGVKNASETATLADALKNDIAAANAPTVTINPDATSANGVFSSLAYGYYLIVETGNTKNNYVISRPMLVSLPDANGSTALTVNVKNSLPTINKKIVDAAATPDGLTDADVTIPDHNVQYQSIASIPTYEADAKDLTYDISDTMYDSLTYNNDLAVTLQDGSANGTVLAAGDGTGNTYKLVATTAHSFEISLSDTNIQAWGQAGYTLKLSYSAKLDSSTVKINYGKTGNPNTITLKYSTDTNSSTHSISDTVITYAVKLIVAKQAADDSEKVLTGAVFNVLKADGSGNYVTDSDIKVSVNSAGNGFTFTGLTQGTYKLVETTAPAGYNRMDDVVFTVSATYTDSSASNTPHNIPISGDFVTNLSNESALNGDTATWAGVSSTAGFSFGNDGDGNITFTAVDSKGFVLPFTGGIGTTLFTAGGILILLAAGILLAVFIKKKHSHARA